MNKRFSWHRVLLALCAVYFVVSGGSSAMRQSHDFLPVYSGIRCISLGCNPYDEQQLSRQYGASGGTDPAFKDGQWSNSEPPVYPPSIFVALWPVGLLRLPAAALVWFGVSACLLLAAVGAVVASSPQSNRWLANLVAAAFLLNSVILLRNGQPAGVAIALLALGCVLLWRERYLVLAACMIAVSLAIKPQIGGLLVVYLLIRSPKRIYVGLGMAGAVAILVLGGLILQSHPQSSHWIADLRVNLAASVMPGHVNDPAMPTAGQVNLESGAAAIILNSATARLATYAALILLLAVWFWGLIATLKRGESNPVSLNLLFSALVVFSLLSVYHRHYDTPVLLITLPAILAVYNLRPKLGSAIALVTVLANTHTQWYANAILARHWPSVRESVLSSKLLFLLVLREENIMLALLFCLYLAAIFTIRGPERNFSRPAGLEAA